MPIALYMCCTTASVMMPLATILSNLIGVGPWMWPISFRVLWRVTASLLLMKPDTVSDYWTEDMTVLKNLMFTRTGTLNFGGG